MSRVNWLPVVGLENKYLVSDTGLIRSIRSGKLRKLSTTPNGYLVFTCMTTDGRPINKSVHRAVSEAFLTNPNNKPNVNHKDLNKQNNHVNNLEWCTQQENINHAIEKGVFYHKPQGEASKANKLTEIQVVEIKKKYIRGVYTQYKLAEEYGVTRSAIAHIIQGNRWSYLNEA